MLIYNTTYNVDQDAFINFLIWMKECYVVEVEKHGVLKNYRLLRVLNHRAEGTESVSLQWEVENSTLLHKWHIELGVKLNQEMIKMFGDKVVGFPTMLEVME